jgi:transposase
LALVDMTVVEQRYRAVLAVEGGERKVDVAAQFRVSRQAVHDWCSRYAADGLAGLVGRSRRPGSCAHQTDVGLRDRLPEWCCALPNSAAELREYLSRTYLLVGLHLAVPGRRA